jgi:hypothetical protein
MDADLHMVGHQYVCAPVLVTMADPVEGIDMMPVLLGKGKSMKYNNRQLD